MDCNCGVCYVDRVEEYAVVSGMSILNQYGCTLVASKPDAEGLCTYKIMCGAEELATIDRACMVDEAMEAAERFLETEEEG